MLFVFHPPDGSAHFSIQCKAGLGFSFPVNDRKVGVESKPGALDIIQYFYPHRDELLIGRIFGTAIARWGSI